MYAVSATADPVQVLSGRSRSHERATNVLNLLRSYTATAADAICAGMPHRECMCAVKHRLWLAIDPHSSSTGTRVPAPLLGARVPHLARVGIRQEEGARWALGPRSPQEGLHE